RTDAHVTVQHVRGSNIGVDPIVGTRNALILRLRTGDATGQDHVAKQFVVHLNADAGNQRAAGADNARFFDRTRGRSRDSGRLRGEPLHAAMNRDAIDLAERGRVIVLRRVADIDFAADQVRQIGADADQVFLAVGAEI